MNLLSACLYLLLLSLCCGGYARTNTFYTMGLFPTESRDPYVRNMLGIYPRAAARYALERINQLGVLNAHNLTLNLTVFDPGCRSPDSGARGLIQAVRFAKKLGIHDTTGAGHEGKKCISC